MRNYRAILSIVLLLILGKGFAATIHWVNLVDVGIPSEEVQKAVHTTEEELGEEVNIIKNALGYEVRFYPLHYPQVDEKQIRSTFNLLPIRTVDVVIVSVLAHGYNAGGNKPMIYLTQDKLEIPYEDILDVIYQKRPAYVLSLVNACNKPLDARITDPIPNYQPMKYMGLRNQVDEQVVRNLFRSRSGITVAVTFLSSQPGDFTYITRNGGFAFRGFMNGFRYWTAADRPRAEVRWEHILATGQAYCISETQGTKNVQCPFSEILNVRVNAYGTIEKAGESLSLCD